MEVAHVDCGLKRAQPIRELTAFKLQQRCGILGPGKLDNDIDGWIIRRAVILHALRQVVAWVAELPALRLEERLRRRQVRRYTRPEITIAAAAQLHPAYAASTQMRQCGRV